MVHVRWCLVFFVLESLGLGAVGSWAVICVWFAMQKLLSHTFSNELPPVPVHLSLRYAMDTTLEHRNIGSR